MTAVTRDDMYDTAKAVATRWAADRIHQWRLRLGPAERDRLAARWGSSIASQVLDAVYDAIHDEGVRAGREQAAADLLARANEIEPGVLTGPRGTRRRTLLAAARIAAGPITPAQAAQALAQAIRDGSIVVCNLDDAGRAIEPHGTTAPAQDAQGGRTTPREGHPVGAPHTNAPRPAHAAMIDGYMSPHDTTGMDSCHDQACVCTCHDREADHGQGQ